MRVLVVSKEVWRDDQNGGNTLSSIFTAFPSNVEFAQIFCSEGFPDNKICNNYFKLSTTDLLYALKNEDIPDNHFFTEKDNISPTSSFLTTPSNNHSKIRSFFNKELFRELVWSTQKYKSNTLKEYIIKFNPDIIFAPGYGLYYMNNLIQWISSFIKCPIISLISDDYYTYSFRSLNPFYWVNQPFLRHSVRKTSKLYKLVYTMTNIQKKELEQDLHVKAKILVKSIQFTQVLERKSVNSPIKLIYAGSLYAKRWTTLVSLVSAIKRINTSSNAPIFFLDIYTGSKIKKSLQKKLNQKGIASLHDVIPYDELMDVYKNSDIALHIESFNPIYSSRVRMSFSTKIIDCISSGCMVMCICDNKQGGYDYINSNDIGMCIDHPLKIHRSLHDIMNNPQKINFYRQKSYDFGLVNHDQTIINKKTYSDFCELIP